MKGRFTYASLGVLCALLACWTWGCSTGTEGPPVNIAGNWQFTARSTPFAITTVGNVTLQQNGSSVSGQASLSGTPCATSAALSGTINGTSLRFTVLEGTQSVSFSGSVSSDGNSASGTYTAPSGGCTNGDFGTWTGTRGTVVAGLFSGSLRSIGNASPAVQIVANLAQGGEGDLTGTAALTNSACFTNLTLRGSVNGVTLEFVATDSNEPPQTIQFKGTVDRAARTLAVTYIVAGGHCAGESGSGALNRLVDRTQ